MMVTQPLLSSVGVVFLGLLTTGTTAQANFDCGTDASHASPHFLSTLSSLHSPAPRSLSGSPAARAVLSARSEKDNNTAITIDTVFHIVSTPDKKSTITNDMPADQLAALNKAYAPYAISFNLLNVTWTTNPAWAVGAAPADTDMKKSLRQGTYRTLNLYFQTDLTGGVLGRCSLPSDIARTAAASNAAVYAADGCNVNANTMPGGDLDDYNKGLTAVHETGHWLGLLHTFEGNSCDGPGDYIADTNPEREATDGCPVDPPKSSCADHVQQGGAGGGAAAGGNAGSVDPIHNFMDYSSDVCYEGFTDLQRERMHFMFNLYRDGK